MLIVISVALLLIFFVYSLAIIVSFNDKADKRNLDLMQSRRFKIKMVIAGIALGLSISIPFLNGENLTSFIYMSFFWCTVLSLGLAKVATRTISKLGKNNKGDRNI
jgi:hypothetical protein